MFDVVSQGLLGLKSYFTLVTMVKVYPESFQLQVPCQVLPIPALHTAEGVRIKFQLRKVAMLGWTISGTLGVEVAGTYPLAIG